MQYETSMCARMIGIGDVYLDGNIFDTMLLVLAGHSKVKEQAHLLIIQRHTETGLRMLDNHA